MSASLPWAGTRPHGRKAFSLAAEHGSQVSRQAQTGRTFNRADFSSPSSPGMETRSELPGATMRLGPGDEARVERWLVERGVMLDDGQRTPQCRDRLRWALFCRWAGDSTIRPRDGGLRMHSGTRSDGARSRRWRDRPRNCRQLVLARRAVRAAALPDQARPARQGSRRSEHRARRCSLAPPSASSTSR